MKELPPHLRQQKPVGNLGTITIRQGTQLQDGSCNFCSNFTEHIHILTGKNIAIRLCDRCLTTVANYAKDLELTT